jgi:hypothetical protein
MWGSTRADAWAVVVIAAGIATSCGGQTADQQLRQDGSGGTAAGSGSGAGSSVGGSDASGGLAASGGWTITLDAGSLVDATGGSGGEGVEVVERCNDLFHNGAVPTPLNYVAEDPPTASGGTPMEGLYHLTQWDLFIGTHGIAGEVWSRQETLVVTRVGEGSADVETLFGELEGEMGLARQWNETLALDGSSYTSTLTCRTPYISVSDSVGQYSATDDQLVFITEHREGEGTWVRTYTRQ